MKPDSSSQCRDGRPLVPRTTKLIGHRYFSTLPHACHKLTLISMYASSGRNRPNMGITHLMRLIGRLTYQPCRPLATLGGRTSEPTAVRGDAGPARYCRYRRDRSAVASQAAESVYEGLGKEEERCKSGVMSANLRRCRRGSQTVGRSRRQLFHACAIIGNGRTVSAVFGR
jgi:hypothetical protein